MQNPNILVVDDEGDFRETLMNRLKKRSIVAAGCASGEEALRLIESGRRFDVIILDIKMPGGMDGITALREIKRRQPDADVILLTGHASLETSLQGMQEGASDYLLKPIKLEDLLEKMVSVLDRKGTAAHRAQGDEIRKLLEKR